LIFKGKKKERKKEKKMQIYSPYSNLKEEKREKS